MRGGGREGGGGCEMGLCLFVCILWGHHASVILSTIKVNELFLFCLFFFGLVQVSLAKHIVQVIRLFAPFPPCSASTNFKLI